MKRKILVAYDGSELSEKAMEEAKVQASFESGASIDIVTVITPGASNNDIAVNGTLSVTDAEALYPKLHELKEGLERDGYSIQMEMITDLSQKNPGTAIVDYAEEKEIDLIIVGHRGLSNLKKFFLGSVSDTIVKEANCNVLIIN